MARGFPRVARPAVISRFAIGTSHIGGIIMIFAFPTNVFFLWPTFYKSGLISLLMNKA